MSIKARAAVEMLMPRLRRFGTILSGSQVDGDWLARRARAQALGAGRPLQDAGRLEVWLFQKMRTLWLDEMHRRRVDRRDSIRAGFVRSGSADPLDRLHIEHSAIRDALASMPEEDCSLLVMVCLEDFSYKEVAEVFGVSVETLMRRLARAREELSARLGGGNLTSRVTPFPTSRPRTQASGE
jgi:RNA polymerase sigma-70 factor, ECF subfamily